MTKPLQIAEEHRDELDAILRRIVPGGEVWVHGSRATGQAREASDLDLVVFLPPDDLLRLGALREAFEESRLPFRVDLHVWDALPAEIQRNIRDNHVAYRPSPSS